MSAKPLQLEPPKKGTIWMYDNKLWVLFDITKSEYIFQTQSGLDEKKVKIKSFGKGWQLRNNWDDVPTKKPPPPSPSCSCSIL